MVSNFNARKGKKKAIKTRIPIGKEYIHRHFGTDLHQHKSDSKKTIKNKHVKQLKTILSLFIILAFLSCLDNHKIENKTNEATISTFYFIPHAEKDNTNPNNTNPELSQKGLGRAMHWADILNNTELDAIYSSDDLKTSMTAAPTSIKKNINMQYYNPKTINIEEFKTNNLNKNVLIVGNSKTIPDFVNKMVVKNKYVPLNDDDNSTLFIVQAINDITTVQQLYFNCSCLE